MPATFDPGTIRTKPRPTVYVKAAWSDIWQVQPNLICTSIQHDLYAIGRATFRYHHGCMIPRGSNTPQKVYRQDFSHHWVKVVYTPEDGSSTQYWFGIVTSEQRSMFGIDTGVIAGDVDVVAHSIEYLLTRSQITSSYVETDTTVYKVNRGLTFNELTTGQRNKTAFQANKSPGALPAFAANYTTAEAWTAYDVCEYLLTRHMPDTIINGPSFGMLTFAGSTYQPVAVPTHCRTVYDVLNEVIDRKRGLSWFLDPTLDGNGDPTIFRLRIKQLNSYDITLPDATTLEANEETITIDIGQARDVIDAVQTDDYMQRYNRVVVEGAPMGTVYTATRTSIGGSLVRNWSDDQAVAYQNGASGDAGYLLLDITEQKTRNDRVRLTDELRRVYTSYKVDESRAGYAQTQNLFPVLTTWNQNPSSASTTQQKLHYPSLRFEPMLPLLEGVDYSSSSTIPPTTNPAGAVPQYRKPYPIGVTPDFKVIALDSSQAAAGMDETQGDGGFKVSCDVEVSDTELAFMFHPNSVPHVLQSDTVYDGTAYPASHQEYGYLDSTYLACTLYLRGTENIRVAYPESGVVEQNTINDQYQELTIRLGNDARLDWMVSGTIVGVDGSGATKTAPADRVLRDDRPKMATIARMAWEWYRRPRKALTLRWKQIVPYSTIRIGKLVERLAWSTVTESDSGFLATLAGVDIETLGGEALTILGSSTAGVLEFSEASWLTLAGEPIGPLGQDDEIAVLGEPIYTIISSVSQNFETGETVMQTQFGEIDFQTLGAS